MQKYFKVIGAEAEGSEKNICGGVKHFWPDSFRGSGKQTRKVFKFRLNFGVFTVSVEMFKHGILRCDQPDAYEGS